MLTRLAPVPTLSTLLALTLSPSAAWAQSLTIDDFDSGKQSMVLWSDAVPASRSEVKRGTMMGDFRTTVWTVAADAGSYLSNREGRLEVIPDACRALPEDCGVLLVENGIDVVHQLQLYYGFDHRGEPRPLDQDVTAYDRLSLHFHSLDTTLSASVILYTDDGADVFQLGKEDSGNPPQHPLYFDFSEFQSNVTGLPPTDGDLDDVDRIDIYLQSGGQASDFALDDIVFEVAAE